MWKHKWISPSPQSIAEVKAEQLSDIRNFFSDPASARVGFAFIQECAQEFTALNTGAVVGAYLPRPYFVMGCREDRRDRYPIKRT